MWHLRCSWMCSQVCTHYFFSFVSLFSCLPPLFLQRKSSSERSLPWLLLPFSSFSFCVLLFSSILSISSFRCRETFCDSSHFARQCVHLLFWSWRRRAAGNGKDWWARDLCVHIYPCPPSLFACPSVASFFSSLLFHPLACLVGNDRTVPLSSLLVFFPILISFLTFFSFSLSLSISLPVLTSTLINLWILSSQWNRISNSINLCSTLKLVNQDPCANNLMMISVSCASQQQIVSTRPQQNNRRSGGRMGVRRTSNSREKEDKEALHWGLTVGNRERKEPEMKVVHHASTSAAHLRASPHLPSFCFLHSIFAHVFSLRPFFLFLSFALS